jgi:succinate dehydrogenase/fumarate reductase flavoprotein subunit
MPAQRRVCTRRGQRHARHHASPCTLACSAPGQHGRRRVKIAPCASASAIGLKDNSKVFNTARIEALEVENLMEAAQATIVSGCRPQGMPWCHTWCDDYEHDVNHPTCPLGRNDTEWHKHTFWYKDGNRLAYKPVRPSR